MSITLMAITLMAIAMLAVVRTHALEPVFGGLDRAVRFHRILGPSAILLLIAHVIFLALAAFQNGTSSSDVFIPFWSPSTRSIDILVFYLLLLLGGLAYDRRMSYEHWLSVHRLTGLVFLGSAVHAAMEPGTIADFEPLRTWMVILMLAGGAAWLYRVVRLHRLGPRYRYRLETVVPRGRTIIDLVMRPVDRRMMCEPGYSPRHALRDPPLVREPGRSRPTVARDSGPGLHPLRPCGVGRDGLPRRQAVA